MAGYTVIDVETTGLSPAHHDRVVEIGLVYVSHAGEIQGQWSTLVNPQRDVGPTRIHGLTASDVIGAPTFADLAPHVLRAISGRILVAHNASFDLRFLAHELGQAGVPLSEAPLSAVCTMKWSTSFLNAPSRRLDDCCRAAGVSLIDAHSALGDAHATAQLLTRYLKDANWSPPWVETLQISRAYAWPTFQGTYPEVRMVHRGQARAARQDGWLDQIVSRMPRAADPQGDAYLATLEMVLLDGFLAEHEKQVLVAAATESGLSRGQVLSLNADYLRSMAVVALEDGVVTAAERAQLEEVGRVLGLSSSDVDHALERARANRGRPRAATTPASSRLASSSLALVRGDRVVFTGDMHRERGEWESIVCRHGLTIGGVTKGTKVVVASDPNSPSRKAAKARTYGVPIITEAAFEQLFADHVARESEAT
jgi:DNA polymerase-3 subunit epsilon